MNLLRRLKHSIAAALSTKSAYDLAGICTGLGLAPGETSEAFSSKYKYVSYRLESLGKDESIQLAKNVLELGDFYHVQEALDLLAPLPGVISAITRRQIIDAVSDAGSLEGRLYVSDFLNRIFPLKQMSWDNPFRTSTLEEGVLQHMVRNDDWSYKDFFDLADSIKLSERRFRTILEEIVHPEVRTGEDQKRFVDLINPYLLHDGFELLAVEEISGYPVFRVIKKGGVSGHSKNLIFAANGPKPKLVLADAINNDIGIVKNQEYCLVYDLPIGMDGLRWKELVKMVGGCFYIRRSRKRSVYTASRFACLKTGTAFFSITCAILEIFEVN